MPEGLNPRVREVITPLFDQPLEGPVYFRSSNNLLPDLVVDLHGQVYFVQVGFVDSVHRKGSEPSRVRTIFDAVPDVPVTKAVFELKGGKNGLIVNSRNLCKVANIATVKMVAQNNKSQELNQRIATSCAKRKR
jgi:hypothetical protein